LDISVLVSSSDTQFHLSKTVSPAILLNMLTTEVLMNRDTVHLANGDESGGSSVGDKCYHAN